MKAKFNAKSRRIVIAISVLIVLAIIASIGGYTYIKSNDKAEAISNSNETHESEDVKVNEINNNQTAENEQNDSNSESTNVNNNENKSNNGATEERKTTNSETRTSTATGATVNARTAGASNEGTSTSQGTVANTEGNVATNEEDATTTYEDVTTVTEKPWETHKVEWNPESFVVNTAIADIDSTAMNITANKKAIIEGNQGITAVSAGEKITYEITVTNNDEKELNSLYVSDVIPQGTTFESADENGAAIKENEVVWNLWNLGMKTGDSITLTFTVVVNEDAKGDIENTASVESKETNTTKTPVLESEKTSVIKRDKQEVEIAKINDEITYTIRVKNTGNEVAKTKIIDNEIENILKSTELINDINVYENNVEKEKISSIDTLKNGYMATINENSEIKIIFTVRVKSIDGTIKNIATVGKTEVEDEVETAGIKIVKEVYDIERNNLSIGKDNKVKDGDIIKYNLIITNTGSIDLKNVILKDELKGINIVNATNGILEIGDLKAKETKTIKAEYKVTYEADIKNNENKTVYNKAIATGDVVKDGETTEKVTDESDVTTVVEDTPKLNVTKTVKETPEKVKKGDKIVYEIHVENTGNVILKDVKVTDNLNVEYKEKEIKAGEEIDTIETLNPGDKVTYQVIYTVTQEDVDNKDKIVNTAIATDGKTTDEGKSEETPTDKKSKLDVTKTSTAINLRKIENKETATVKARDVIEYTITVTNNGTITLKNINVTDSLKVKVGTEIKYIDAETGVAIIDVIDSLKPRDTKTIKAYYTVTDEDVAENSDINSIYNVVKATADNGTTGEDDDEISTNKETSVKVSKIWDDNSNQDGIRPKEITFNLYADKKFVKSKTIEGLECTFDRLPTYNDKKEPINYTVTETTVDGYETEISKIKQNEFTVTNKHVPEKTSITVNKIWDDGNNRDNIRPKTVSVSLLANGKVIETRNIESTYTFEDLPKYIEGKRVNYTVQENDVSDIYRAIITGSAANGYTITNKQVRDITINKVWNDGNNIEGIRKDDITVRLKANGVEKETAKISGEQNWSYTFKKLPKYENNQEIIYTVEEIDTINGYNKNVTGSSAEGFTVTNTLVTSVKVNKEWNDGNNADNTRPGKLNVSVKNGENIVASNEIDSTGNWSYTFENLPKYNNDGILINYTVSEENVDGYIQEGITYSEETGYTIKNTELTNIELKKVWLDNSNKFETRPDEVVITFDNTDYKLNANNDADKNTLDEWTYIVPGYRKYDANGNIINYTAQEKVVPNGYTKVSEINTVVTNRADLIVNKNAYKATTDGSIGKEATSSDVFRAGETVYYKLTIKNAGDVVTTKTLTDTIALRLNLISVAGTEITAIPQSGVDAYNDKWNVTREAEGKSPVVTWEVSNLNPGETREIIIKTSVVANAEYKDLCQKTGNETSYKAKLFVRKDGKVPYENSGKQYDTEYYTGSLGTVSLTSDKLYYDTEANLKNDDLYYLINNNNKITEMVSKGISRTELVKALSTNGIKLGDDEVVVWYVIKNSNNDGIHIDGVIRKISELTTIENAVVMDNVVKDKVDIDLEDIEIGQRGIITTHSTVTTSGKVSTPMDVVFVLDTSGSMKDDEKASKMINAVNQTIKTVMNKNSESRIGVVGYSDNAESIINLGNHGTNGEYLGVDGNYYGNWIYSNVGNKKSRWINGGTNIAEGIRVGAEMLTASSNKTKYEVSINGETKEITRTPILVLVTDGEPTYYYENETATGRRYGEGNWTNGDFYYWTLRTAKHYKNAITTKYYAGTKNTAKVFTIGIGLSKDESIAMLNPTEGNVNNCNDNTFGWNLTTKMRLYNLITNNGTTSAGAYSYADGTASGGLTEEQIKNFLETSIDSSQDDTKYRSITTEESKARKVELGNINTEKAFLLKISNNSYTTLSSATSAGYLKKNANGTYYIDLTKVSRSTEVSVEYWPK